MYLKSECSRSNEDDFVQDGETMKELTVTISLCEYRNLIREQAQNEEYINELKDKLKKLESQAKMMTAMVLYDHPEFYNDMFNSVKKFLVKMSEREADERSDTDERDETV